MGSNAVIATQTEMNIELLEKSFELLAPRGDQLVDRFYDELFRKHPGVQPLFAGVDMARQKRHLLGALVLVVANLRSPEKLKAALAPMGRRHQGYGAIAEHYGAVASTMLSAMAQLAGNQWKDEIESAWSEAFRFIASEMLAGYQSA